MIVIGSNNSLQIALAAAPLSFALKAVSCYFDTQQGSTISAENAQTIQLSTTPTALVASPSAGTVRHLSSAFLVMLDSVPATVTITLDGVPLFSGTLAIGDTLDYERTSGRFMVIDSTGAAKQTTPPTPVTTVASAVAASNLQAGQPVYINGTTGQMAPASAAAYATSFVAGLSAAVTASAFVANLATDFLTLNSWVIVTGTALLQPGQRYFLGITPGTLSPIAPTVPGQVVAAVGQATSPTQFRIQIGQPILL
jgi:hypothetical protein